MPDRADPPDRQAHSGSTVTGVADSPIVPLDPAALARLRELDPDGRHGVLQRVLQTFETSLVRMLEQLRAELDGSDRDVLRSIAHTLKASSAAVGATPLARTCQEIEAGLRDDPGADPAAAVQRLVHECEHALRAVGAMLRP